MTRGIDQTGGAQVPTDPRIFASPREIGAGFLLAICLLVHPYLALARTPNPPPTAASSSAAFKSYDTALAEGRREDAADALITIVNDTARESLHGEAWLKLATLLDELGLDRTALHAYGRAIESNPRAAAPQLRTALDLAEKLSDEADLAASLSAALTLPLTMYWPKLP
jgi:tetratricopeptide (TPR) repeat protein